MNHNDKPRYRLFVGGNDWTSTEVFGSDAVVLWDRRKCFARSRGRRDLIPYDLQAGEGVVWLGNTETAQLWRRVGGER